jgi:hypothetical protein
MTILLTDLFFPEFFAKTAEEEGSFARLRDVDRQILSRCGLLSNQAIWRAFLSGIEENHPIIQRFRQGLIDLDLNPDSPAALEAQLSFAKEQTERARSEKSAYDASACLRLMVERSHRTADGLFARISN